MVNTCIMYHADHDIQLAMRKIDPFVQFVGTELLLMCIGSPGELRTAGTLYKVMVMTPAEDI